MDKDEKINYILLILKDLPADEVEYLKNRLVAYVISLKTNTD